MATRKNAEQENDMTAEDVATEEEESIPQEDEPFEVEFVDELPKITRAQDSGVWSSRLEKLSSKPGVWAKVHKTDDKSPHPTVNMLKRGNASGVDKHDYDFTGRTIDGVGYVFAKFLTPEERAEKIKREEEEKSEREATERAEAVAE